MKTNLITFCFCWLLTIAYSSPYVLPDIDPDEEMYDWTPEAAENFFRLPSLANYDIDSDRFVDIPLDYGDESSTMLMNYDVDENPMSFGVEEKPMDFDARNPMNFDAEEKLLSFDTDDMPYSSEDLAPDDNIHGNSVLPFRQAVQKFQKEQSTTMTSLPSEVSTDTEDKSISTAAPDVLASMPPVLPNKGQKEFVMLRPPTDNNKKIERWMEEMANDLGIQPPHTEQKRQYAM